jgi:prepilin-type N-terminal cleavage/methylation domain-containing protein
MPTFSNEKGFPLIELLAVMAVIAILASLAIPMYRVYDERTEEL